MSRIQEWNNIQGSIIIECGFVNGKLIDSQTDKELPQSLISNINKLFPYIKCYNENNYSFEIIIKFLSSGYYDPGRIYGDPYYCYPPEGCDERTLDDRATIAMFNWSDAESSKSMIEYLDKNVSDELFEIYYEDITEKELDFSQYDDSDYQYEKMIEEKYEVYYGY